MNYVSLLLIGSRIILVSIVFAFSPANSFSGHDQRQQNNHDDAVTGAAGQQINAANDAAYSDQPIGFRLADYRAPVPKSLTGATTINTAELEALLIKKQVMRPLLIDALPKSKKPDGWPQEQVWLPEPHLTIPSAYWLPEIGFGTINEMVEIAYKKFMRAMTHNNLAYPVVVFCRENCWISWNAAKRLLQYGYRQIYWYPEGMDGWIRNLNDTAIAEPEKLEQP